MSADGMPLLDTIRTIETPEGVSIRLRLAGLVPRALAWLFDFFIRFFIYLFASPFLASMGNFGLGLLMIGIFLLEWFYPVLFEVYAQGATPGKKLLDLAVLQDDGVPVGWSASMVRNLLRVVDFLPLLYAFGLCSLLLNRDFKRLGDIAARTIVVHRDKPASLQKLPSGAALPLPVPLSPSEQQLIVAFAARVPRLTPERAQELARILGIADGEASPRDTRRATLSADVDSLLGYARHIVGER